MKTYYINRKGFGDDTLYVVKNGNKLTSINSYGVSLPNLLNNYILKNAIKSGLYIEISSEVASSILNNSLKEKSSQAKYFTRTSHEDFQVKYNAVYFMLVDGYVFAVMVDETLKLDSEEVKLLNFNSPFYKEIGYHDARLLLEQKQAKYFIVSTEEDEMIYVQNRDGFVYKVEKNGVAHICAELPYQALEAPLHYVAKRLASSDYVKNGGWFNYFENAEAPKTPIFNRVNFGLNFDRTCSFFKRVLTFEILCFRNPDRMETLANDYVRKTRCFVSNISGVHDDNALYLTYDGGCMYWVNKHGIYSDCRLHVLRDCMAAVAEGSMKEISLVEALELEEKANQKPN